MLSIKKKVCNANYNPLYFFKWSSYLFTLNKYWSSSIKIFFYCTVSGLLSVRLIIFKQWENALVLAQGYWSTDPQIPSTNTASSADIFWKYLYLFFTLRAAIIKENVTFLGWSSLVDHFKFYIFYFLKTEGKLSLGHNTK